VLGLLYGALLTPIILETALRVALFTPNGTMLQEAVFNSFAVAAFVEESFKLVALYFLFYKNHNFNERFDGIVYAVFISLGFAFVENIMYVINPDLGGFKTAIYRAIFSIPGHALFGVSMGYYMANIRFNDKKLVNSIKTFLVPFLLHGTYNLILSLNIPFVMGVFVLFVAFMYHKSFKQMKMHLEKSPFK